MKTRIYFLAALAGLSLPSAFAADPPKLEGDWSGTMKVSEEASLLMVFHVKNEDGKYSATFDSPNQGAIGIKVDTVTLDARDVTLGIALLKGEFQGRFSDDGSKIEGKWTQGKSFDLILSPEKTSAKPDQMWEGTLKFGGMELRVVLNLFEDKDTNGDFSATFDSPDQGAKGIVVDSVKLDEKALGFTIQTIRGEFSGDLNDAGTEAKGQWKQGGQTLPLTLKKTDKVTQRKRTQVPEGPFPYREIQVSYPNREAGLVLAGTLTLPERDGPFPVVLLISGSGPQDRDETLLGHKPFLVLADDLARRGIGALRFDDRGVGKSTGDHGTATSADFATDVEAGIAYLKTRSEVDASRIGLMGHSEGGLIAPMVAAKSPDDVAFLVLLAGPGLPGDEILIAQTGLILKAMGGDDNAVARQVDLAKAMYEVLRAEKDETTATDALVALVKDAASKFSDEEKKAMEAAGPDATMAQIKRLRSPWFRFFLTYDPRPTLAKIGCPVLAINGEKDLQVPPRENLEAIEQAIKSGGNDRVTIKEIPGLNHLFQPSETGSPSEYARIEETFSPRALKIIGDWIEGLPKGH